MLYPQNGDCIVAIDCDVTSFNNVIRKRTAAMRPLAIIGIAACWRVCVCVCVCVCDSNKALDFWLSHLQSHKSVLARHYLSPAFLLATSTDVSVHRLYLDLITAVQPLAQLPFHIDYDFELDQIDRAERSRAAADRDPAAGVRRSLARQSSVPSGGGEAGADVGRRLRTVLGRLGSSATQSLVLARSALQASSSQTSISPPATTRPPRYTDECRVLFISVTWRRGPSGRPFSVADLSQGSLASDETSSCLPLL